jgi:hypothetical protein
MEQESKPPTKLEQLSSLLKILNAHPFLERNVTSVWLREANSEVRPTIHCSSSKSDEVKAFARTAGTNWRRSRAGTALNYWSYYAELDGFKLEFYLVERFEPVKQPDIEEPLDL